MHLSYVLVLGCPDIIQPPSHAWYQRQGDTIQVGCVSNHNRWDLVCEGNQWEGVLGNCSSEGNLCSNCWEYTLSSFKFVLFRFH